MKNITIGFSKSSSKFPIFSWLILLTQKTPYSHVYIKYRDEDINRTVYFQSSHTLVNYMSETTFLSQETVIQEFDFQVSDASFVAVQQFALDNAGKPYGLLSVFGLAIVQLASLVGVKIHNPLKDAGATWICDQIIASLLSQCENVSMPMPVDDMFPQDVYALVSSLPKVLS